MHLTIQEKNVFGHLEEQYVHFLADIQLSNEEQCFNRVKILLAEKDQIC